MTDRALNDEQTVRLNDEQTVRLESLRGDLAALRSNADAGIPIPEISDELLRCLVRQGSPHATLPSRFLARCGFELHATDELSTDEQLSSELWKLIWIMALLRLFLEQTDHLSDRDLYRFLTEDALLQPTVFVPGEHNPPFYTIDPLGAGSSDDHRLLLTYYGDTLDPELKSDLQAEFPEPITPKPRPFDRDRFLP